MSSDPTCKQLIDFLDDYVAGRLAADVRASFDGHLALCPPCRDYVRTYSDTAKLARPCCCAGKAPPLPEELVRAILSATCGKSQG